MVASRARKIETVSGLMNLVMMPMFVTSGVFFSSERFPDVVQPLVKAMPLTALNDALRAVILEAPDLGSQLARIGISFKRIAGVDGKTSDLERELFSGRASLSDVSGQSLTREEIGCHLSHLEAFDEIQASGVFSAIILEDDLIISPRFQSAALALAAHFSGEPVVIKLEPWNKPRLAYMARRCGDFDLIFT